MASAPSPGAIPAADTACREIAGFVRQAADGMLK
jgi:hypothetical protein